jgi:hypothetical protein
MEDRIMKWLITVILLGILFATLQPMILAQRSMRLISNADLEAIGKAINQGNARMTKLETDVLNLTKEVAGK